MVLKKTLESPLDCKEIQSIHPKGNQHWIFHWKDWCCSWSSNTMAKGWKEANSLEKTLMLGEIGGKRRRGQQRMRWLDGITKSMDMSVSKLGNSEGPGSLVCCDSWGRKESDTAEQLNWTERFTNLKKSATHIKPFLKHTENKFTFIWYFKY